VLKVEIDPKVSGAERYRVLEESLIALLEGEPDALANLANAAGLVAGSLDRINWCGFYLLRGEELVLGPFQGKPACVRIPVIGSRVDPNDIAQSAEFASAIRSALQAVVDHVRQRIPRTPDVA